MICSSIINKESINRESIVQMHSQIIGPLMHLTTNVIIALSLWDISRALHACTCLHVTDVS